MRKVYDPMEVEKEYEFNGVKLVIWAILCTCLVVLLFSSVYIISAGQRGVLMTFGNPDLVPKSEGLHFKIPFVQKLVKMDIQTQKYEAELTAASQDLQDVKTKIAINYRIIGDNAPILYRDIGLNYADKIIYPLEQEVNKAITSQFTAEELVTKRETVREKMKSLLYERLQPRGIIVEEISIINFQFSESFTQAIENKVTAEQNALTAKNKLEQIKYEAQQRITQATAEAEAIKIQAQAITVQGGKEYVQLQSINKWNGVMPTVVAGNGAIPFINIPSGQSIQTNQT